MSRYVLRKRIAAVGLASALALNVSGCQSVETEKRSVKEATAEQSNDLNNLKDVIEAATTSTNGAVDKEETVYVSSDAGGAVEQIIVSDWLHNGDGAENIEDSTDLTDVKNVKGDENYALDGEKITWAAQGNDIYYQGVSTKEMPVDMKITYTLDGQEVTPEEIAGKSGKVTIRFDYTNKEKTTVNVDGTDYEVYVPYSIVSGMILKNENFSNVKVTNGKVISDGEKNIVVGVAMPGLKESLGLDEYEDVDLDIPDCVEVTADVTNFTLDMTLSAIMPDLFSMVNTDDITDLGDLEDAVDTLSESADKLADGTLKLYNGVSELDDKFGEYSDGVKSLVAGLKSLDAGTGKLSKGAKTLKDGTKTLKDGMAKVDKGASDLNKGSKSLSAGATKLKNGADKLSGGLETFRKTYDEGVASSKKSTSEYITTTTAAKLNKTVTSAMTSAATIGANDSVSAICSMLQSEQGKTLINQKLGVAAQDESLTTALTAYVTSATSQEEMLARKAEVDGFTKIYGMLVQSGSMGNLLGDQMSATIAQSAAQNTEVQKKIATDVQTQVGPTVVTGMTEALTDLGDYLSKQTDASQAQVDAMFSLSDGYKADATQSSTLMDGADALGNGLSSLVTGSEKLSGGTKSLLSGTSKLSKGSKKLYEGANSLQTGINQVDSGAGKLLTGGNSLWTATGKVSSGIELLRGGSKTLNEGMDKFNTEGIQKITTTIKVDLKKVLNRVKAVKKAADGYHTFTKLADGKTGSVKFIIETKAVKAEDTEEE